MLERYRGSIVILSTLIGGVALYVYRVPVTSWLSGQITFFQNTSANELWTMFTNFLAEPSLAPFTSLYMVIAVIIFGLIFFARASG